MLKSQMIKPANFCMIGVIESMKRDLKPDERIIWEMGFPMVVRKGRMRLYAEKAWKELVRVMFGTREHIRGYKRRIK